jgi:hypothetical protein
MPIRFSEKKKGKAWEQRSKAPHIFPIYAEKPVKCVQISRDVFGTMENAPAISS